MADVSQTAANFKLVAGTVIGAIETQGPAVAERIVEVVYDGNAPQDLSVEQFMLDMAEHLKNSTDRYSTLSARVLAEAGEDSDSTDAERAAVEDYRDEFFWQRSQLEGTYGPQVAERYGYAGHTPTDAHGIIETSVTTEQKLRTVSFPAEVRPRRQALDPTKMADDLARLRAEIEDAASTNKTETRETQQARRERNETERDWNYDYRGVAQLAVGLFLLAREDELAEKVRPTARRNKGLPEPEDLDTPDQPAEPAVDADEPVEA